MDNISTEISLAAYSTLVNEVSNHLTVDLFSKESLDADKPILVVNLPSLKFTRGTIKKVRTYNMCGGWYPDISVSVVVSVGVPVEEALLEIGMNSRRAVINLEFYCEKYFINSLG